MKKLSWITGILAGLMIVFAALGSVCNAVYQISIDETFYCAQSRDAVRTALGCRTEEEVTAYIGLTEQEQQRIAEMMRIYMLGEEPGFDLPMDFSHEESRHMLDVLNLTTTARDMSKVCLTIAAVLCVMMAWTGAKLEKRVLPKVIGMLGGAAVIVLAAAALAGAIGSGGFAAVFTKMHEMLFTNDLWIMDPAKHLLIRMMPQLLFERALVTCVSMALRMMLAACLMLLATDFIVGGMIRRQLKKD